MKDERKRKKKTRGRKMKGEEGRKIGERPADKNRDKRGEETRKERRAKQKPANSNRERKRRLVLSAPALKRICAQLRASLGDSDSKPTPRRSHAINPRTTEKAQHRPLQQHCREERNDDAKRDYSPRNAAQTRVTERATIFRLGLYFRFLEKKRGVYIFCVLAAL